MHDDPDDAAAMAARYARRASVAARDRASLPVVQCMLLERRRAVQRLLLRRGWHDASQRRVVEIGCGDGGNLKHLLTLGFAACNLAGIDVLPERVVLARAALPSEVALSTGDAATAAIAPESQDLVLQFTVFSSLLHTASRQRMAAAMWSWLRPGGAVLSYDFAFASPGNPDVRKLTLSELKELFPSGLVKHVEPVTLAPPLARVLCRISPSLYGPVNRAPWLRTHRLVWIEKPAA